MCKRFNLTLLTPVTATEEKLTPADFRELARTAKENNLKTILIDAATSVAVRQQIEEKTTLTAIPLDPLGTSAPTPATPGSASCSTISSNCKRHCSNRNQTPPPAKAHQNLFRRFLLVSRASCPCLWEKKRDRCDFPHIIFAPFRPPRLAITRLQTQPPCGRPLPRNITIRPALFHANTQPRHLLLILRR